MEIMKQTAEIRVDTHEEAKALIEKCKSDAKEEGYDVISSAATLKEKKSKGEVIDSYYIVKIIKRW